MSSLERKLLPNQPEALKRLTRFASLDVDEKHRLVWHDIDNVLMGPVGQMERIARRHARNKTDEHAQLLQEQLRTYRDRELSLGTRLSSLYLALESYSDDLIPPDLALDSEAEKALGRIPALTKLIPLLYASATFLGQPNANSYETLLKETIDISVIGPAIGATVDLDVLDHHRNDSGPLGISLVTGIYNADFFSKPIPGARVTVRSVNATTISIENPSVDKPAEFIPNSPFPERDGEKRFGHFIMDTMSAVGGFRVSSDHRQENGIYIAKYIISELREEHTPKKSEA